MPYDKLIVCLANSWKPGGTCVAGREIVESRWGGWVRPVSDPQGGAVPDVDRLYEDRTDLMPGDVIRITCIQPVPHNYQHENHLYDKNIRWRKEGRATWEHLLGILDNPADLWGSGYSSSNGTNDRVPEAIAMQFDYSLALIQIERLVVEVSDNPWESGKRRVRVSFDYNGTSYDFKLTDPFMTTRYLNMANGNYELNYVIACVSLGELLNGYAYKLVAGLFTPERLQ